MNVRLPTHNLILSAHFYLSDNQVPVAADEETGDQRPFRDIEGDDGVSLLDTQVGVRRTRTTRKKGCCVCCGLE